MNENPKENLMDTQTVCECGDPGCVYVDNLTAAIDWLEWATTPGIETAQ